MSCTPLRSLGALCVIAASGCMSLVSEGQIGERQVRVDGTGFAWLDSTVYQSRDGRQVLTDREDDDVTLHVLFTEAVFDPTVDLRTLPPVERARVLRELTTGDLLRLYVRRGSTLAAGDVLSYSSSEPQVPEVAPYLSQVQLLLGSDELAPEAEYPDEVRHMAQALSATVSVNDTDPRLLGVADVKIRRRGAADLGVEGDVTVRFDVPLVNERVAECNFSPTGAGDVDPCGELSFGQE